MSRARAGRIRWSFRAASRSSRPPWALIMDSPSLPTVQRALPAHHDVRTSADKGDGVVHERAGQVYSWGLNKGQLGHSDLANRTTPELISALAGKRAVQVACGFLHSLVLTEDNVLYSFG